MLDINNGLISTVLMTGLALYGFITGVGTVVGEITPDIGIPTTIGGFIFALLTAIFRQGNVINNIDKNIEKSQQSMEQMHKTMEGTLEVLKALVKKNDELNELLSKTNMDCHLCHEEEKKNTENYNVYKVKPILVEKKKQK